MRRYERWLNSLVAAEEIRRDLLVESPLCHPSVVIRRRALEDVGHVRRIRIHSRMPVVLPSALQADWLSASIRPG